MIISLEFISGCMLGVEYIDKSELYDETGWCFVIDLLIIRIVLDYS